MKLMLCDKDGAYIDALLQQIVRENPDIQVTAFSEEADFLRAKGSFDIAVMAEDFLAIYESGSAENLQLQQVMQLIAIKDTAREEYAAVPKYQSTSAMIAQIRKAAGQEVLCHAMNQRKGGNQVICVYSPVQHELKLPVALCISHWCSQRNPVLFLNLEEMSAQSLFMDTEGRKDLLDLLYVAESRRGEGLELQDFLCEEEGVQFIPPINSPAEVAYITGEQWMNCRERIQEQFTGTVIVLLDHIVQGFEQMLMSCDGLILLTKPGQYYRYQMETFRRAFLQNRNLSCWVHPMVLPMSAAKIGEANYSLSKLLRSKLAEEVGKELENVAYLT
ncbi:MAG: hypothetical protein K6A05_06855 [Lachnospiraceae bacterium]|nr:hypothetical protein [Lachnospiraceae bacterium]